MNTHLPSNIFFPVTIQDLMEILSSSLLSGVQEPIKKGRNVGCAIILGAGRRLVNKAFLIVFFSWGEGLDLEGAELL